MKTEISLPDNLFEAADELAKWLEVSRNELISGAGLASSFLDQLVCQALPFRNV
jgi:metal-responsive CopG/Arc/MetJ family transcriptional regulator